MPEEVFSRAPGQPNRRHLCVRRQPLGRRKYLRIHQCGDSPGYPAAPYVNGQFSNGNVWVQDLAKDLGLAPLTPSLLGGTDYAVGGAETSVTPFNLPTSSAASDLLTGQLPLFESAHATADPNALYTIWIGSNDLTGIATNATPTQYSSDVDIVAGNIDTAINTLAGLGAKNFLILTVSDLGLFPGVTAAGPGAGAEGSALSAAFDSTLVNGSGSIPSLSALAEADGIHLSVLDTYALFDVIGGGRYGIRPYKRHSAVPDRRG
ncbi:MAG TPA: SGNH/GDSL hydrolase family protein [Bryobacteraceae bacterium]